MPAKGKKSLPVNKETHRLIKVAAAEAGVEMNAYIDSMFAAYSRAPSDSRPTCIEGDPGIPERYRPLVGLLISLLEISDSHRHVAIRDGVRRLLEWWRSEQYQS